MGIIVIIGAILLVIIFHSNTAFAGSITQFLGRQLDDRKPSVIDSVVSQPVSNLAVVTPVAGEDTSLAVRQTATVQSQSVASKVAYPTAKIGVTQRDFLFIIASSFAVIGVSLYVMTLMNVAVRSMPASRRPLYKIIDT